MPKYVYECKGCEGQFQKTHGIHHIVKVCDICNSELGLFLIPEFTILKRVPHKAAPKPGHLVKKHINSSKEELKKEKERLKKELYNV